MEIKKAIKKVIALGTGATMVGATIMGAMAAADLANYPAPFFNKTSGKYEGVFVLGSRAAMDDMLGVTNIVSQMQSDAYIEKPVAGTVSSVSSVSGESFALEQSSNKIELDEFIGRSVEGSDLSVLKGDTIRNSKGSFPYKQYLKIGDATGVLAQTTVQNIADPEDSSDKIGNYLVFTDSVPAYEYRLEFSPALVTSVDPANGNLKDLRDKSIKLFGKTYTITEATTTYAAGADDVELTLMTGSSGAQTQTEYTTKTYDVNGKSYEVEVMQVADTAVTAKLKVNGEIFDDLVASDTVVLNDGTQIGIRSISPNEGSETGGGDQVTFYIGAEKIVLRDTDIDNGLVGSSVKVGETTYSELVGEIKGNAMTAADEMTISSLIVTYSPSDDLYVAEGKKLSDAGKSVGDDHPIFLDGFDVVFAGAKTPKTESIVLKSASDNQYNLEFEAYGGKVVMPLFGKSGTDVALEEYKSAANRNVAYNDNTAIAENDYIVVTNAADKQTHILQFTDVDETPIADGNTPVIRLKNLATGNEDEITTRALAAGVYPATITLGSTQYDFEYNAVANTMQFDLDAVGGVASMGPAAAVDIYTKAGAKISVLASDIDNADGDGNAATGTQEGQLTILSEDWEGDADLDGTIDSDTIVFTVENSGTLLRKASATPVVHVPSDSSTAKTLLTRYDGTDDTTLTTRYGVKVDEKYNSDAKVSWTMTYPDNQIFYDVRVTSPDSTVSQGASSSEQVTKEIVKINVGAAVLDNTITDYKAQNLIVVGGPCVNSVAAQLMGNPAECAEGFQMGSAKIKLFEHANGKVALLVAGYSADDTQRASRVVYNHATTANFKGTELEVTGTSGSDVTVKSVQ